MKCQQKSCTGFIVHLAKNSQWQRKFLRTIAAIASATQLKMALDEDFHLKVTATTRKRKWARVESENFAGSARESHSVQIFCLAHFPDELFRR
jgi:hypothetical protein